MGDRVYTSHKAIRRVADHLAEIEARLASVPTIPDHWHASAITTPADHAPFTADDLDKARSRLIHLAQVFDVRLRALPTSSSTGRILAPGRPGSSRSTSGSRSNTLPPSATCRR